MTTSGQGEQQGLMPQAIADSLEQVREILFGPQHREFARKLARADHHIAEQAEELRNETRRRLEVLETYVRKELEALAASNDSGRSAQLDAMNNVSREWRGALGLLEERVKKIEERVAWMQSDVRQQILDQANSFIEEVRRTRRALGAAVERELGVPRGESVEPSASEAPMLGETREGEERGRPSKAA